MKRLALLFLLVVPAFGGTVIDYECHTESSTSYSFTTRVSIDGPNARYDVIEGSHPMFNPMITIISRDEGTTLIIVDHKQRTYFIRKTAPMSGALSTWKAPGVVGDSHAQFEMQPEGTSTIAGREVHGHRAHASYDLALKIEGEALAAHVDAQGTFWTIEGRNNALPFGVVFAFKSGLPSLDIKIERRLPRIGIPLKQTLSVTRTISGGSPIREDFTATATKVVEEKLEAAVFQAPMGYQFREPTFGYAQ